MKMRWSDIQHAPQALCNAVQHTAARGQAKSVSIVQMRQMASGWLAPPPPFSLRAVARNRWAAADALCSLAESASYKAPALLSRLAPYCDTPAARATLFGLFIASTLVIQPCVALLRSWVNSYWTSSVFAQRNQAVLSTIAKRTDLWPGDAHRTFCQGELTSEGIFLSDRSVACVSTFISSAMSLVMLVGQVSAGISPLALGMMLGASLISWGVSRVFPTSMDAQTPEVREAQQALIRVGATTWDNVVLGNKDNADRWAGDHQARSEFYFREARRAQAGRALQMSLSGLQWSVQSAVTMAAHSYTQNFPGAPPIISLDTIGAWKNVGALASSVGRWTYLQAQYLDVTKKHARSTKHLALLGERQDLRARIFPERITITGGSLEMTAAQLLEDIDQLRAPGFYTLRGGNGSGKTTFLLDCKRHLGDDALLVPASHALNFPIEPGSSGQTARRILQYLREESERYGVLLLDEWDSHLDDEARQDSTTLLEALAQTHSVVQGVHR